MLSIRICTIDSAVIAKGTCSDLLVRPTCRGDCSEAAPRMVGGTGHGATGDRDVVSATSSVGLDPESHTRAADRADDVVLEGLLGFRDAHSFRALTFMVAHHLTARWPAP